MRNFRTFTGPVMAATASLLLMTACGGGSDGEVSSNSTTSSTQASTTTTAATTSTTAESTTTTSTTTTTLADPFNLAAATLVVQHSGFCMTVSDAVNGSNARQFACVTGDASQSWEVKPTGTGSDYTIRNLQSNLCLRVNDAALNADPSVLSFAVQGTCDGSSNTLWNFQASPTAGEFNIVAKHSGLCLDVTASDVTPGKEIIQYTCSGAANQPNQRWKITAVAP